MISLSQNPVKTSTAVATLFCAVLFALTTVPVNAQSPANRVGEFKRLPEQLGGSSRSQDAEGTGVMAEPGSASAIEQQQENSTAGLTPQQKKPALAGSWICDHVSQTGDTLRTLQAFTEDGRAFTTAQGDIVLPVLSPQFGSWESQGGNTFAITVLSIVYDPSSGPAGTLLGTAKISETVTLDESGNSLTGRSKFTQIDTAGNVVYTNETTFRGTRITVEPLN